MNSPKETIPFFQLEGRGIKDEKVLKAIRNLPRDLFVSVDQRQNAYEDFPLPIGCQQTISQPFIVAYMTEKLTIKSTDKVLEIGTGSGFQAAVLAQLVKEVHTIEIYEKLAKKAKQILDKLGFYNIHYKIGNGKEGWKLKGICSFWCNYYYFPS